MQRALTDRTAPFNYGFVGFCTLDSLLDFINDKWKTKVNEKYIKDWLKSVGHLWKNKKQTRQIYHPELGRPRVWLLWDKDELRDMTEGELGQHHKASYTSYNKSLYNFHVEGSVDISPPSYEQQQEIKRKELMDYIKYYLGPKASAFENLNFAANLLADQLMIQNLAKKKELHRPTNATHIGTPRTEIDPEKVLDKYNSQIKDLKNKIRKDLDEYIPDKNLYEKRQQKS